MVAADVVPLVLDDLLMPSLEVGLPITLLPNLEENGGMPVVHRQKKSKEMEKIKTKSNQIKYGKIKF